MSTKKKQKLFLLFFSEKNTNKHLLLFSDIIKLSSPIFFLTSFPILLVYLII